MRSFGSTSPREAFRRDANREGERFEDDYLTGKGYKRTIYDYELPDGTLLYQQCRYDFDEKLLREGVDAPEKRFLPRRPTRLDLLDRERNIGEFVFGPGNRRVIYNWTGIVKAGPGATVFVAEGEKNAAELIRNGLVATTVLGGWWNEECVTALTGCDCIILEDNDDNGRKRAATAQRMLSKAAKVTRVVTAAHLWKYLDKGVPGPTADVSDWLNFGGNATKLVEICREVPAIGAISAEPHSFPVEEFIPMWDFLYGKHLLRKTVSVTAAAGEVGKSTKSITEALAMTTGKALLGIRPPKPLRVVIINLEDDRNTMDKRIAAAMKHHGLSPADVGGRLIVIARGELKLKLATQTRNGVIEPDDAAIKGLTTFLMENQIDVLSIDPLRKTHRISENDTVAMGELVELYEDIAAEANCAVHIWHHLRKGNGGDTTIDSVRGASTIVDASRSCEVMEKMTKENAKKLGIEEQRRRYYLRAYNGKINFAPPIEQSNWFEIKNVQLNNAGPLFGDNVGVVTSWHPPTMKEVSLSEDDVAKIKEAVGSELRWRHYHTADMWVGKAVAPILGLDPDEDKERVKVIVKKLIATAVLKTEAGKDPGRREEKMFVVVCPSPKGRRAGMKRKC